MCTETGSYHAPEIDTPNGTPRMYAHKSPTARTRIRCTRAPHAQVTYTHALPKAGMGAPEHELDGPSNEQGVEQVNLHSLPT